MAPDTAERVVHCPLGETAGCRMVDGCGTCPTALDRKQNRLAREVGWVCVAAFRHWVQEGRPALTAEETAAMAGVRKTYAGEAVWGDHHQPAIATAPADWDRWDCYCATDTPEYSAQVEVLDAVRRQCGSFNAYRQDRRRGTLHNLVMLGNNGTGKTLLARIYAKRAHRARLRVMFAIATELVKAVKGTNARQSELSESGLLRPYLEADVLVLDDVRPVSDSQADENIFNEIIGARYGEDRGEPWRQTVITSQLQPPALQAVIGSSAYRRLFEDGAVGTLAFWWPAWKAPAFDRSGWAE